MHPATTPMRAIVYTRYGPPEVLTLREVERPTPRGGEVLIRVRAAEATKADCELRSFRFPVKWFAFPLRLALGVRRPRRQILGGYFAGEIAALGEGVETFAVGDAVYGAAGLRMGAYAEYVSLPESCPITAMPANLSFEEAATVPLGGLNAIHFMRRARIRPGNAVLINGAGGSIGLLALQIAKSMGAEVTAVDAPHKERMVVELGADRFIDYTKTRFSDSGETWDVVFDMVASSSYSDGVGVLRPGGRYLMGNPRFSDMIRSTLTTRFTDKTSIFAFADETKAALVDLKKMIEDGRIQPVVDRVLPMEQVADAHRLVESERRVGGVVIAIGPEPAKGEGRPQQP